MVKYLKIPNLGDYDIQRGIGYGFLASAFPIALLGSSRLGVRVPARIRQLYPEIIIGSSALGGLIAALLRYRRMKKLERMRKQQMLEQQITQQRLLQRHLMMHRMRY